MLNRAVVINELEGPARAIECVKQIPGIDYLKEYYLLHAILGELNMETGNAEQAMIHYRKALLIVASDAEKSFLRKKMRQLEAGK